MILQLLDETKYLLRTYLSAFVKRDMLQMAEDVLQVDYKNPDNHVSDEELDVGTAARRQLISMEDDADPDIITAFYRPVIVHILIMMIYETAHLKII